MADRSSHLLNAVARGHYRQVKFFIDAQYDLDSMDEAGMVSVTFL